MIKKIVLTAAVAAAAVSLATTPSFAKKAKKVKEVAKPVGTLSTGAANTYGWGQVSTVGFDGKEYPLPAFCYVASGVCPK